MVDSSVLLLTVVTVVLALGAVLLLLPIVQLTVRAKRDFQRARGTQHRKQIEHALAAIRTQVGQLQGDTKRLEHQMTVLEGEEARELDHALARYLVSTRLGDVPGVGRARIQSISDSVFRSQLSDLHSAHHVPGIGPTTQAAISNWVNRMQSTWPQLRSASFSDKQQILDGYAAQRQALEQQRVMLVQRITTLQNLDQLATRELQVLSRITTADFRRALKVSGDRKNAEDLQRYILGLFPPWGTAPPWYTELLSAAAGERAVGRIT